MFEPWPLLSEAAQVWRQAGNPPQAFEEILTSGAVQMGGKRGHLSAEPIAELLYRVSGLSSLEVRLDAVESRVTLAASIDLLTRNRRSYADIDPTLRQGLIAELDGVSGGRGREMLEAGFTVTFGEVRVDPKSLSTAAARGGYKFPILESRLTEALAPSDLIPLDEACSKIQRPTHRPPRSPTA
jgi:hypothetical protein